IDAEIEIENVSADNIPAVAAGSIPVAVAAAPSVPGRRTLGNTLNLHSFLPRNIDKSFRFLLSILYP
ncbi:MAG: hypothetical protein Q4D99_02030, partial [Bacillota bacterium]|nr:hypothetical protein [Bacillota bacterium]